MTLNLVRITGGRVVRKQIMYSETMGMDEEQWWNGSKKIMVNPYSGVAFNLKKEWNSDTFCMDKP